MSYSAFEQALAQAVAQGKIAGAVALVTDRTGPVYQHAHGVRAAGSAAAMDADTVFWIASMTKAVVSIAALQLVEQGKLSLDADLSGLLPDLAGLEVMEGVDADGKPRLRPARTAVTLRQLLTHTSGFAYGFTSPEILAYLAATGAPDSASGSRAALRQPLVFEPGTGFIYGIGIDWAGLAVEAASGQKLDAYVAEHITGPLGMTDTGFALSADQVARQAGVHVRGPDGALIPIPFALPANAEVLSGGGGLYSTVPDYARFLRMLMNEGRLDGVQVLAPETVRGLAEIQTGPDPVGGFKSALPNMSNDFDPHPHMGSGHGLATFVAPAPTGRGRAGGTLAWAGLANTYYWADPASGVGGVLMTQVLPFADPTVLSLLGELERGAYGTA
ncbi:serine hydrolase domain-containing protein [Phenylobacterium aquaticum]|uniref:serine hydrolase domain-containing protein n=1 Tax=Phenylobacterium aquaticum TaxID=1763816 RepID=UPI001F5DD0E5|nr:serine hydrolase domain-containing protein [Phenylobacterium aquaticum]MCI3134902.1 beta-lactamase family protein [Phenylobacterium aquaticum]